MGGGRNKFMKDVDKDPLEEEYGHRVDNRDLIKEWSDKMRKKNLTHKYVSNLNEFNALKPNQYEHVLGRHVFF